MYRFTLLKLIKLGVMLGLMKRFRTWHPKARGIDLVAIERY